MTAYYNECDEQKAFWLRELIRENVIAPGEVDERSIADVDSDDLRPFTQAHFFAGSGGWSYALRLAGWPDDRPVWTGSCPCSSFSCAGKGQGFDDPRHLWPAWSRLIAERKPPAIFGEQADDAIGYGWLDLVQTDLERTAYSVGKAVLGACSVGAPHIRQRLYLCAYSENSDGWSGECGAEAGTRQERRFGLTAGSETGVGSESIGTGLEGLRGHESNRGKSGWLDTKSTRLVAETGVTRGFWRDCDWWYGRDGKYRPIEPGIFPLAHGAANCVLKLRGYGDAIVAELAAEFIQASEEAFACHESR